MFFFMKGQINIDFFSLQLFVTLCDYNPNKLHSGLREASGEPTSEN